MMLSPDVTYGDGLKKAMKMSFLEYFNATTQFAHVGGLCCKKNDCLEITSYWEVPRKYLNVINNHL